MTATPANSRFDELDGLLTCLFDPGLSEAQTTRIETLLASEPTLQDRYADYVLLHAALSWRGGIVGLIGDPGGLGKSSTLDGIVFRDTSEPDDAAVPPRASGAKASKQVLPSRKSRGGWRSWGIAAAVLLVIGAGIMWRRSRSANLALARVTATVDARWGDGSSLIADGTALGREPVNLASGYVQLSMTRGAEVIVHGPARFTVLSANSIRLEHGALTAVVPTQAIGFTVELPACTVQDLGTEFGVTADSTGASAVEVFKGTVQLTANSSAPANPSAPAGSSPSPLRLVENQSAHIAPGQTTPTVQTGAELGFVRTLDRARVMEHVIGWWRFEEGQAGQLSPSVAEKGPIPACRDASPNGNDLFAFNQGTAPRFSEDVPAARIPLTGDANYRSMDTRQLPGKYLLTRDFYTQSQLSHPPGVDLQQIEPAQWTVEVSIKLAALNRSHEFQTIIERDGVGADANDPKRAPFYLQLDNQNHFTAFFCDPDKRAHWAVARDLPVHADQWYHLAAVSDGKLFSLFVDSLDGKGFQRVAFESLPADGSIALANMPGGTYAWAIGRAQYNGRATDRFNGLIDEVRISDQALDSSEFLFGASSDSAGK